MDVELTTLDGLIVNALRSGEMNSTALARAIGRKMGQLTYYDRGRLDELVQRGLVEREARTRGAAQTYYVYRLKDGG
jgi:predicted transcriptional regulator